MKTWNLAEMIGGWFVGDFQPTCFQTSACEVACKHYRAGDREASHLHKVAVELTLVATGRVRMNDQVYTAGQIILIEPGEATDFTALEDATTVVVKMPSVKGDKYLAEPREEPLRT